MIYEINSLSFAYRGSEKPVLDCIDLSVDKGEVISILGRNGAGKSTLLGCMLGLLEPSSGSILLGGEDIGQMSERAIAARVGYVPQAHQPSFGYSVLDFVLMGCASAIGMFSRPGRAEREAALAALEELGILHLAERPYTEISGGERQQATIAQAIVSSPQIVLFDEPTAHLDFGNQLRVMRIIKQLADKGYAVVITTHNPDHALLLGGKAAFLRADGSLICGGAEEVITSELLSDTYGVDVRLEYIASIGRSACVYPQL